MSAGDEITITDITRPNTLQVRLQQGFYRAMLRQSAVMPQYVVCLSVSLSVTFMYTVITYMGIL